MKKTRIIKQIVGEKLREYGFTYLKTDGPCRIFIREVQGIKRYYDPANQVVKQYGNIQESSFYQSLTARFCADVFGYRMGRGLEELNRYGTGGWLSYLNEKSYKERLRLLADFIVGYGLDLLEKMSREEEIIPTKAMAEKLFDEHEQLADAFAEEFQINTVPVQPEYIDVWFCSIKKMFIDSGNLPYKEVKELLVKISAYIGEKACEMCSYEWLFPAHFEASGILGNDIYPNFLLLDIVVDVWKDQSWKFMKMNGEIFKQGIMRNEL